jgi:hypothetical protein
VFFLTLQTMVAIAASAPCHLSKVVVAVVERSPLALLRGVVKMAALAAAALALALAFFLLVDWELRAKVSVAELQRP